MPELPEVDAITGVVRKHAIGKRILSIKRIRDNGKYLHGMSDDMLKSPGVIIDDVFRIGKRIVMPLSYPDERWAGGMFVIHNAMTGYLDWEHAPWTFDYVEGARTASDSDVRVKFLLSDDVTLRFHDARLFGRIDWMHALPSHVVESPELMRTPNDACGMMPVITLEAFARGVLSSRLPVKQLLMEQEFLAGIGNIYSSEACHLAGVDPRHAGMSIHPAFIPVLLEALRCVVAHSIPQVTYQWLNVYRRTTCGSCGGPIVRCMIAKRATFLCERCQT